MNRIKRFWSGYRNAIDDFTANAKYMLMGHALQNVGVGILLIAFGLYVVSWTGSDIVLGQAEAAASIALALICLMATPLVTMTGFKQTMIFGAVCYLVARFGQVFFPFALPLILFGFMYGLGEGINQASVVPFLSQNSKERHRDYLFSVDLFVRVGASFIGCIIGGFLPFFLRSGIGAWQGISQQLAYQITVVVAACFFASSLLPLRRIKEEQPKRSLTSAFKRYYATIVGFRSWKHVSTLVIPQFTIALGAGITMPFISRYLQQNLQASDAAIGIILGVTQLFIAISSLAGPFLKRTLGVRWSMVLIQASSLPFLIAIPHAPNVIVVAPILWIRTALMNVSWPLFNQYSMQNIRPSEKTVVGASIALSWALGQIVGDLVGGNLLHAGLGDYSYYITAGIYLVGVFFIATMIKDDRMKKVEEPAVEYIGEGEYVAETALVDETTPESDRF